MRPNPCIEVQTSSLDRPSVPAWFAEVVIIVQHLATKGLLDAFAHQVRLVRGRFGSYEPIDFLALLRGYAISGERTLAAFFERLAPFEPAFMALFGRRCLPHRSSLSRFLADVDPPCLEAFRGGRKRGEVIRTRTTALQMHTRQWVGTYAGRGNGDYREELASALQAITAYLKHFALPSEVALVRLDGQYGDAAVIAQLILAGVYLVTRGRGYQRIASIPRSRACWLIHRPRA
jgi:hypothetical protein